MSIESGIDTKESKSQIRKSQLSSFDIAGKPKKDPLVWRIQKQTRTKSKMNISVNNAYKRSDEIATSLYATQSMLEEGKLS